MKLTGGSPMENKETVSLHTCACMRPCVCVCVCVRLSKSLKYSVPNGTVDRV